MERNRDDYMKSKTTRQSLESEADDILEQIYDSDGFHLLTPKQIETTKAALLSAVDRYILGLIGEDEVRPATGAKRNGIEQGLRRTRNKLRAALRQQVNRKEQTNG